MLFLIREILSHNIFTTLSEQMLSDRLLLIVIDRQRNNLSYGFKLELIITYHLWFIMKILR